MAAPAGAAIAVTLVGVLVLSSLALLVMSSLVALLAVAVARVLPARGGLREPTVVLARLVVAALGATPLLAAVLVRTAAMPRLMEVAAVALQVLLPVE